jgi:hypothetical protein
MQLNIFMLLLSVAVGSDAYSRDEKYVSNVNLTTLEVLMKIMDTSDLILPPVDPIERGNAHCFMLLVFSLRKK